MIDREKVIKGLREMSCRATWKDIDRIRHKFQPIINDAVALLKEQEAAGYVLPVRCKDCIHGKQLFPDYISCQISDENESGCHASHKPEWFCADGIRREYE